MRSLIAILILLFSLGCNVSKKGASDLLPLNGTWIPVKQQIGGTALPPVAFAKQQLVISDSNYTFTAESVDKGVVQYKGGKMDIYGKEGVNSGKHFTAIYKMENSELFICYNLKGDVYPGAFDTKGKLTYFLCVFKKN